MCIYCNDLRSDLRSEQNRFTTNFVLQNFCIKEIVRLKLALFCLMTIVE